MARPKSASHELKRDEILDIAAQCFAERSYPSASMNDIAAASGTVTRVASESFGSMSDRPATAEIEIRASWTPTEDALGEHLLAWGDLLCTAAGLPPLPAGVVPLSRR